MGVGRYQGCPDAQLWYIEKDDKSVQSINGGGYTEITLISRSHKWKGKGRKETKGRSKRQTGNTRGRGRDLEHIAGIEVWYIYIYKPQNQQN